MARAPQAFTPAALCIVANAFLVLWRPSPAEADPAPEGALQTEGRPAAEPTVQPEGSIPSLNYLERARSAFEYGVVLAQRGLWEDAVRAFTTSARLAERPNTLFNLALAHIELNQPLPAFQTLARFLELTRGDGGSPDRRSAQELLEQQRKRLTQVRLHVAPDHAAVFADGRRMAGTGPERTLILRPGEHHVRVAAAGHRPATLTLVAGPGATLERALRLRPEAAAARHRRGQALTPAATARALPQGSSPVAPKTAADKPRHWLTSPWLWTAVVVVVTAGAVVAAVAVTHGGDEDSPRQETPGGNTGLSL